MTSDLAPVGTTHLGDPGIGPPVGVDPRSVSWSTAGGAIPLDRPRVMGILNITPDSFWGGSRTPGVEDALRRAEAMVAGGADILDVGGESTRPGATPVDAADELDRVLPVIRAVVRRWPDVPVSVDTIKAEVARAACDAGAAIINDVSAFRLDPAMAEVAAAAGAGVVLMHSRGTVERMASYDEATYDDAPAEVAEELAAAAARARAAGIAAPAIALDPGLGFSKRTADSAAVLRGLGRIVALGHPVLVGPSRKRFVGELAGGVPADERLPGTIAACLAALARGARIFRVHDVAPLRQALDVAEALAP